MHDMTTMAYFYFMYAPVVLSWIACASLLIPLVYLLDITQTTVDVSDAECKKVLRGITRCSPFFCWMYNKRRGTDFPEGFMLSKRLRYLAFVSYPGAGKDSGMKMILWCSRSYKKEIECSSDECNEDKTENGDSTSSSSSSTITFLAMGPEIAYIYYVKIIKRFPEELIRSPEPGSDQFRITHKIIEMYHRSPNNNIAVLVYGPPGTGKSTIVYLVARFFDNAKVCQFNPTRPGESIDLLHGEADPSSKNPLILAMDEYDKTVSDVFHQKVAVNSKVRTLAIDKPSHNTHCDNLRTYPNTIIIRTMNTPKKEVDMKTDPSFLRPGRNDAYFVCKNKIGNSEFLHEDPDS